MPSNKRTTRSKVKKVSRQKPDFSLLKILKNNFTAYYLLLTMASPRKLSPYYDTFIYSLIRLIAKIIIKIKEELLFKNHKLPKINLGPVLSYAPRLSYRALTFVIIFAVITTQVLNVGAFEAHIINVTAKIINDVPDVNPNGGQFCKYDGAEVTITTTYAAAEIIYTLDGSDPTCPDDSAAEFTYTAPFTLTQSATLKTRSCHDNKQSSIVTSIFDIDIEYCSGCGNGLLDPGEQCDDGNKTDGDGCSSTCQNECTPAPEICDGIDNDCDGSVDNNIYEDVYASSTPFQANLENGTNVTQEASYSDNIYAIQPADNYVRFIYLQWYFSELPAGATTTLAELLLEHHENKVSLVVQWKKPDNTWIDVCTPLKSTYDINSTCNLLPYLDTTDKARDVNLRLRMVCLEDCEEYLDLARLKFRYRQLVDCPVCGDGKIQDTEQCDDGNTASDDGCSSACQTELPSCLKINEIYYNTDSRCLENNPFICESEKYNEWLELYNGCTYAVNLKDWQIKSSFGAESFNYNYPVEPGQFAVIAANGGTWNYWPDIPNEALKISLGKAIMFNYGLYNQGDRLFLYDSNNIFIDSVSWGDDTSAFNPSVPIVTDGHSISRKIKGVDTDTAADWFDTYSGSTPPGPNPGTNPHDANGNLLMPETESLPALNNSPDNSLASSTVEETSALSNTENQINTDHTSDQAIAGQNYESEAANGTANNDTAEPTLDNSGLTAGSEINNLNTTEESNAVVASPAQSEISDQIVENNEEIATDLTPLDSTVQSDDNLDPNNLTDETKADLPATDNQTNSDNQDNSASQPAIDPVVDNSNNQDNSNQQNSADAISLDAMAAVVPEPAINPDSTPAPVTISGE